MDTKALLASLATEQVNSRSERLDQMTSLEIATLMNDVTADVTAGIERRCRRSRGPSTASWPG